MFGTTRKGLFGAPMMGADPLAAPGAGLVQQDAVTPTYKKPSTANLIIGTLGDTLSQWGGGKGTFLPGLQMRQQQAAEAAQYQQQRADQYTDWERKQQYEAAHPSAGGGTALQQNYEYLKTIDPNAAESYLRTQTTAPPIVQTNPDGTKTIYPSGAIPQAGSAAPRQILQQLPPGAVPMGGAPSQGARTFPVR